MTTLADLASQVDTNISKMSSALKESETRTDGFNGKLKALRGPLLEITGSMVSFGAKSILSAQNLEQSIAGVNAVFGEATGKVLAFSQTSVDSMALSQQAFNEAIVPLGTQLQGAGLSADETATAVIGLSESAADMAATFGGTSAEALNVLSSALNGNAGPALQLGLSLGEADIRARALALGLADSTGRISEQAKAAAFLSLVEDQTATIQGRFAEESNNLFFMSEKVRASFEDFSASLGQRLLPIADKVLGALNWLLDVFNNLPGPVQTGILVAGLLTAGLGALLFVIPLVTTAVGLLGVTMTVALAGIPLLVGAAVAAGVLLLKNWDKVVEFMKGAGGWILAAFGPIGVAAKIVIDNWDLLVDALRTAFNFIVDFANDTVGVINSFAGAIDKVAGLFGKSFGGIDLNLKRWEESVDGLGQKHSNLADDVEAATGSVVPAIDSMVMSAQLGAGMVGETYGSLGEEVGAGMCETAERSEACITDSLQEILNTQDSAASDITTTNAGMVTSVINDLNKIGQEGGASWAGLQSDADQYYAGVRAQRNKDLQEFVEAEAAKRAGASATFSPLGAAPEASSGFFPQPGSPAFEALDFFFRTGRNPLSVGPSTVGPGDPNDVAASNTAPQITVTAVIEGTVVGTESVIEEQAVI